MKYTVSTDAAFVAYQRQKRAGAERNVRMMELSHSLVLNEEVLKQLPENKRPVFVYEWLRFLDKVLLAAQKSDVQQCNKQLVDQLLGQLQESPGPPSRRLLGSCLSQLFTIGDTFHLLFGTVNRCLELVKSRDDSPAALAAKLGAVCCLGAMYSRLGRMMGRSYEDTVQILTKSMRSAESQMRCEVMRTLGLLCDGIGTAAGAVHRDIYKVARHCMTDRVMSVRYAAAHCLLQMLQYYPLLYTGELESMVALCFRALDGSDHQSRAAVAKLLGTLVAKTQQAAASPTHSTASSKGSGRPPARCLTLEDALNILMTGFLRGGSGFLKGTGDMIKGTPAVSREVRVGVTLAYVVFAETMGGLWLERHLSSYITHVLQLSSSPRVAVTHVDTVYVRKCVVYMLRTTLGRMLGEKAQVAACKELASAVTLLVASDSAGDVSNVLSTVSGGVGGGSDVTAAASTCTSSAHRAHAVSCGLLELGTLTRSLGTAAASLITDNTVSLLDCVVSVLIHSSPAARYSAAWCLHCICTAVPSQLTGMIDRCLERLNGLRNSAEAISGYTAALCGLLGAVPLSPLGVPHCSGRRVFGVAEDLLRSAAQNSRLSLARTQTGWMLIGAVASLGHTVVRGLLPRMLLLWRNAFPRSAKELDSEKARGDAFTWQVSLEGRAGALSSMHSLLLHCPELVSDDNTRRLLVPVEAAINMLTSLSSVLKTYGQHLKASLAMMRYRLYEVLSLLPVNALEGSYAALLRLLVSEFTLADNPASTSTCLLRSLCQADDSVVLATRLLDPDLRVVEEQLETNSASGSGALEHDITCLYSRRQQYRSVPGPMPLGVAVIDQAIVLFGLLFPRAANKHRIQMLNHFSECIKQAKGMRQEVIQTNIFAALLSGLRGVTDAKTTIGDENVKTPATQLIVSCMCSGNAVLRVAAAEALGRLGQAVSDPRFVSDMAQISFDKLKSARDVISRTGHSLTLGCLHRYVGSMMGNNQQLGTSVSILLALAQDMSSPTVQVWSLHALCMMADAGGPMFRTYVEPILALCVRLLLSVPASAAELHRCVGRCLSALITTVGPELHGNSSSICGTRSSLLCACAVLLSHEDAHIRAEAMHCLQQLHLFAPRQVNLSTLVPVLCSSLGDSQLILRRAAVSCLRQLTQREARRVSSQATQYLATAAATNRQHTQAVQETGLAGLLFSLLDAETDDQLISDVHDTLQAMMLALVSDQLALWLRLCKDVLTTSVDTSTDGATPGDEDADDDMEQFTAGDEPETHPPIPPRWPTRVFAADMLRKLLQTCEEDRTHFDLALAKEARFINQHSDWLILHLSDLIRMAFMAATSDLDPLRLVGLTTLHQLIQLFSSADDPELPGHLLLQQYQAQVSAALRPAFAVDTPSHVTARACHVCSAWICSGVAREMSDLKRVHQLLVSSLSKLKSRATIVYNESALTLEKLAILKAWAEVYVVAMEQPDDDVTDVDDVTATSSSVTSVSGESVDTAALLNLVKPELANLSKHWLAALKDQALLSLPPEFSCQLPVDGGTFYTNDTVEAARPYYRISWPSILHAAAIWLSRGGFDNVLTEKVAVDVDGSQNLGIGPSNAVSGRSANEINNNRFHLLFGVCMEALCDARGSYSSSVVASCLHALRALLAGSWSRRQLAEDRQLVVELLGAQHRLLLTRELPELQLLALQVVVLAVRAESEMLEELRRRRLKDLMPANQEPEQLPAELDLLGEGGAFGDVIAGRSAVFSVLQVCLCLLTRFVPALTSPTTSSTASTPGGFLHRGISLPAPISCSVSSCPLSEQLVSSSLRLLAAVPDLCSPRGALSVLPTVLYLCTAVLQRFLSLSNADANTERTLLHTLRAIISHRYCVDERSGNEWRQYVESALAKVIDISRQCGADVSTGGSTVLSVMCEFILHAPPDLVRIESLQQPCINHFKRCADSDDVQLRIHCAGLAEFVFRSSSTRPAVAAPYIQILAPQLLRQLHSFQPLESPQQLQLAQQQLSCVQTLLAVCPHDSRTQLLGLYVPALCRFLLNSDRLLSSSIHSRALHQHCMDKLNAVGPLYPLEFKTVVGQSSGLRSCIESAVTATRKLQTLQQTAQSTPKSTPSALTPSANSIKLTMDFSNFRV